MTLLLYHIRMLIYLEKYSVKHKPNVLVSCNWAELNYMQKNRSSNCLAQCGFSRNFLLSTWELSVFREGDQGLGGPGSLHPLPLLPFAS